MRDCLSLNTPQSACLSWLVATSTLRDSIMTARRLTHRTSFFTALVLWCVSGVIPSGCFLDSPPDEGNVGDMSSGVIDITSSSSSGADASSSSSGADVSSSSSGADTGSSGGDMASSGGDTVQACDMSEGCVLLGETSCGEDPAATLVCVMGEGGCLVWEVEEACSFGACEVGADSGVAVCTVDPCHDVESPCVEPVRGCDDATTLTECTPNAWGCLEETTIDCGASTDSTPTCDESGAVAVCASTDPCAGIAPEDQCDLTSFGAGGCENGVLNQCAQDALGCSVLERTDCAQALGSLSGFCDATGDAALCVYDAGARCEGLELCEGGAAVGDACGADRGACSFDVTGCFVCEPPTDECVNASDSDYLVSTVTLDSGGTGTGRDATAEASVGCGIPLSMGTDPHPAVVACMLADPYSLGLTVDCAGCFAGITLCVIEHCSAQCSGGAGPACDECQTGVNAAGVDCRSAFERCTGVE